MFRLLFAFLLILISGGAFAADPERSVSTSREFVVYGGNQQLRGAVCELAERTKSHLLNVLAERDEWKTPVVVNAQLPQANVPELPPGSLQLSQSSAGLKIQLDLTLADNAAVGVAQRHLLRATLIEMIYRGQPVPSAGSAFVEPPDWLVDGLLELQVSDDSSAGARRRAAAALDRGLSQFLGEREQTLDEQSRQLHRTCAAALVQLLVEAPQGRKHLSQFIRDLHLGALDPVADLRVHFPDLDARKGGLEQVWRDALARPTSGEALQPLGIAATQAELDRLLVYENSGRKYDGEPISLENYPEILRAPHGRSALAGIAEALLLFTTRANPAYREIVAQYQRITSDLARGKTHGVAARLARVKAQRFETDRRLAAVDDYLNWFEATQATTRSGLFDGYFRTLAARDQPGRRRDRLSVYLDALEAQTAESRR